MLMPRLSRLTGGRALVAVAENVSVTAVREFPSDDDLASPGARRTGEPGGWARPSPLPFRYAEDRPRSPPDARL